jgi:hypothetical protein
MKPLLMTLALALAFTMASPTFAGTKSKSKIIVKNNSAVTVAVVVNPSQSLQAATTPQEFTDRGGKILNPGESYTFKVDAGTVLLGAALVQGNNIPTAANFTQASTTVAKGKSRNVTVTGTSVAVITVK